MIDFYSYAGYGQVESKPEVVEEAGNNSEDAYYYGYGGSEPVSETNHISNMTLEPTDAPVLDSTSHFSESYRAEFDSSIPTYTPPPPPFRTAEVEPTHVGAPIEPIIIPPRAADSPKKPALSLQQRMAMLQSEIESEDKLKSSALYYGGVKSHNETTAQFDSPREIPQRKTLKYIPPPDSHRGLLEPEKKVVSLVYSNSKQHQGQEEEDDSDVEIMPVDRVSSLDAANQSGGSGASNGAVALPAKKSVAAGLVVPSGRFGGLPMRQANKAVFAAAEAITFVKDLAVAQLTNYVSTNVYVSSFVGCVNESFYYVADRAKTVSDLYINTITSDDPEKRHLNRIKNSTKWQNILLRYSMASLTWKQRQLLEETRDGGTLDQLDLNRLMTDMTVRKSNERLMRIADEYFYITTAPDNSPSEVHTPNGSAVNKDSTVSSLLSNELVVKRKLPHSPEAADSPVGPAINSEGDEVVTNTVAMEFIQSNIHTWLENEAAYGDDDAQFALARFFTAPPFAEASCCYVCSRSFSIILFRHHCRFCGQSVCEEHSNARRCIYRFGLIQPVRVCCRCKVNIDEIHRRDVLIWRESRVQAYLNNRLIPYFNPTVDRGVDKALRIADYSLIAAKNTLILSFPTKVLIETIDILKRYGLSGFTGLLLRKDFLESVETLKRISGMDDMFSMTLHELTACIYYKLAIDRGLRGCNPEGEKIAHAPHLSSMHFDRSLSGGVVHTTNAYYGTTRSGGGAATAGGGSGRGAMSPTSLDDVSKEDYDCNVAHMDDIEKAIKYAPLALKIVYEANPVDCQRLAKSQGWDTIYTNSESVLQPEQPVFTLFGSEVGGHHHQHHQQNANKKTGGNRSRTARKEAVLAIRGTQSIQDVVTDIRAAPQEFPPPAEEIAAALNGECFIDNSEQSLKGTNGSIGSMQLSDDEGEPFSAGSGGGSSGTSGKQSQHWEWLNVNHTSTYACGGISRSAMYILREVGPSLVTLYQEGYDVIIVGHSLGGAVAALLTHMLRTAIPNVYCITYGCPSCVDGVTSDILRNFVLNVVNHDDVISRITPHSIRILMSELMLFREQVFKHLQQDWSDVMARAYSLWSPRWRKTHSRQDQHHAASNAANPSLKSLTNGTTASGGTSATSVKLTTTADSPLYDSEVNNSMVVVEQEDLPELWLPGRIVHIYLHKGQYHAAEVSRTFPDLRRIEVQGNIFEDHRSKNVLNALLEVRSVMHASSHLSTPPDWVPFNSASVCYCCENPFTWHSTFRGDAQQFRDRYNCKHCGNVVCGPCSANRRAIPKYGLLFPERICDTCMYKGDFALLK